METSDKSFNYRAPGEATNKDIKEADTVSNWKETYQKIIDNPDKYDDPTLVEQAKQTLKIIQQSETIKPQTERLLLILKKKIEALTTMGAHPYEKKDLGKGRQYSSAELFTAKNYLNAMGEFNFNDPEEKDEYLKIITAREPFDEIRNQFDKEAQTLNQTEPLKIGSILYEDSFTHSDGMNDQKKLEEAKKSAELYEKIKESTNDFSDYRLKEYRQTETLPKDEIIFDPETITRIKLPEKEKEKLDKLINQVSGKAQPSTRPYRQLNKAMSNLRKNKYINWNSPQDTPTDNIIYELKLAEKTDHVLWERIIGSGHLIMALKALKQRVKQDSQCEMSKQEYTKLVNSFISDYYDKQNILKGDKTALVELYELIDDDKTTEQIYLQLAREHEGRTDLWYSNKHALEYYSKMQHPPKVELIALLKKLAKGPKLDELNLLEKAWCCQEAKRLTKELVNEQLGTLTSLIEESP